CPSPLVDNGLPRLEQRLPYALPCRQTPIESRRKDGALFIVHHPEGPDVVLHPGEEKGAANPKGLALIARGSLPCRRSPRLTRVREHQQRGTLEVTQLPCCEHSFMQHPSAVTGRLRVIVTMPSKMHDLMRLQRRQQRHSPHFPPSQQGHRHPVHSCQ